MIWFFTACQTCQQTKNKNKNSSKKSKSSNKSSNIFEEKSTNNRSTDLSKLKDILNVSNSPSICPQTPILPKIQNKEGTIVIVLEEEEITFNGVEGEEELYLDENAEEIIDDYLEGAPAIIHKHLQLVGVSEDYPTNNHIYCRTKASKTHKETAPEFNHTLIIREKK